MPKHPDEFYISAIYSIDPNIQNLEKYKNQGSNSVVFTALDSVDRKMVYRFPYKKTSWISKNVSDIFKKHKIPSPEIDVYHYENVFFEKYPYIHGVTLKDKINNLVITAQEIKIVFDDVKRCVKRINNISKNELNLKLFKNKKDGYIFHCDLNPGNILLDKDNKFFALLDLESVNIYEPSYLKKAPNRPNRKLDEKNPKSLKAFWYKNLRTLDK